MGSYQRFEESLKRKQKAKDATGKAIAILFFLIVGSIFMVARCNYKVEDCKRHSGINYFFCITED